MDLIQRLRNKGLTVRQFDEFHFRVNNEFDVWFNVKMKGLSWWDRITDQRGRKPEEQMYWFILRRFAEPSQTDVPHEEFIRRLVNIGWAEKEAEEAWQKRHEKKSNAA